MLEKIEGILFFTEVVEENALLRYNERQYIATIKGVGEDFVKMSGIDSMIIDGDFTLVKDGKPYAVIGQGVAVNLAVGLNFISPRIPVRNCGLWWKWHREEKRRGLHSRLRVFSQGNWSR